MGACQGCCPVIWHGQGRAGKSPWRQRLAMRQQPSAWYCSLAFAGLGATAAVRFRRMQCSLRIFVRLTEWWSVLILVGSANPEVLQTCLNDGQCCGQCSLAFGVTGATAAVGLCNAVQSVKIRTLDKFQGRSLYGFWSPRASCGITHGGDTSLCDHSRALPTAVWLSTFWVPQLLCTSVTQSSCVLIAQYTVGLPDLKSLGSSTCAEDT
jgi:hypothetical protein